MNCCGGGNSHGSHGQTSNPSSGISIWVVIGVIVLIAVFIFGFLR